MNQKAKERSRRGFRCSVCGKWHDKLLTDLGCQLPDVVFDLGYLERYRRARYNEDLCTLDDERHFIRCVLPVPFTYTKGIFGWGVWVEVEKRHHDAYVRHFSQGSESVRSFPGRLANRLRGYTKTVGLLLEVELSDEHRPFVRLSPTSRHALAVEQRRGIGEGRHHEIVSPYL